MDARKFFREHGAEVASCESYRDLTVITIKGHDPYYNCDSAQSMFKMDDDKDRDALAAVLGTIGTPGWNLCFARDPDRKGGMRIGKLKGTQKKMFLKAKDALDIPCGAECSSITSVDVKYYDPYGKIHQVNIQNGWIAA